LETKYEGQSRQDQILLLAAEGMTDKEIAARLGLSAETVGTYWRRILAKYNAASRTEVVAKVIELRAGIEKAKLEDLTASFKEVTDHLFYQLEQSQGLNIDEAPWSQALSVLTDAFLIVDEEAFVTARSAGSAEISVTVGEPVEWSVHQDDRDGLRAALHEAMEARGPSSLALRFSYADGTYTKHTVRLAALAEGGSIVVQICSGS
jgi:DNA-binding CsgD family transcriptional regulator